MESSTLSPAWVTQLAALVVRRGARFLDAPVVGSRPQAEAGALVHLVGGAAEDVAAAAPVLSATGQAVHHLGPAPAGTVAKLLVNALFAGQVAMLAELFGAARLQGLDARAFLDALGQLPVASPAVKGAGAAMLDRRFAPMFPIGLLLKDLDYAAALSSTLPMTHRLREVFAGAAAQGLSPLNITAMAQLYPSATTTPNQEEKK